MAHIRRYNIHGAGRRFQKGADTGAYTYKSKNLAAAAREAQPGEAQRQIDAARKAQAERGPDTYGGFATSAEHKADQAKQEQAKAAERAASTARLLETRDPTKKTFLASGEVIEPEPRAPIKLTKPIDLTPEKTGIAKFREGSSEFAQAINAITDPRMTLALGETLLLVTGIGAAGKLVATGVKAGAKALTQKQITKQISKNIVKMTGGGESLIGRRISEKVIQQVGKMAKLTKEGTQQLKRGLGTLRVNEVKQLIAGGANNLKTAALKTSYLARLASAAKNPYTVLAVLGTTLYTSLFWAPNEKGDALVTLAIAQRDAVEAGDLDLVNEIADLIEETADIAAGIPVKGFIEAELAKFEAARIASRASQAKVDKILADQAAKAEEPTFAEERETADVAARERELKEREEDEAYFAEKAEKKRETELEQRKADEEYYTKKEEARTKAKEEERAADEAYWNNIVATNAKRKADERAADEAYWKDIKAQNTSEPWTPADKKVIDDWNAGKSALNFKWLGI